MDVRDALETLGLQGPADPALVKRTYRRLARQLHPDAGGDAATFVRIQAAYEVLQDGTDTVLTGIRPQRRSAGVASRWWDAAGAWHEEPVDGEHLTLDAPPPSGPATRASVDLLATMLCADDPVAAVVLRSRSPGSRLHGMIAWLQPDLLATLSVRPAPDGPRAGHDVEVQVRAAAGRGRRLLAECELPGAWTRGRGSESVWVQRRLRPSRTPDDTARRVALEVDELTSRIGWPMDQWFVLAETATSST